MNVETAKDKSVQ